MLNKFLIVSIFTLVSFCSFADSVNAQEKLTRDIALSNLKKCSFERNEFNCNEKNAEFLIALYNKGDKSLLNHLLNAGLKSDAGLSQTLGVFYAEVLQNDTEFFLAALVKRPRNQQIELSQKAVWADGSGNTNEWEKDVRIKLKYFVKSKNKKLSTVAKTCLQELEKFIVSKEI